MPLLKVETNIAVVNRTEFLKKLSALTAKITGKPEKWVMVSLSHNPDMIFGGTSNPLVYAELKSIGLPEQKTGEITSKLMDFLEKEISVLPERIYIEFSNARPDMWGWNKDTF
jgi:phenylpyruvate tautomerase PptA (4-oxalocrotonate tautomerase family)